LSERAISAPLQGLAARARRRWLAGKIRVRQWGSVEASRHGAIVLLNHQHDDEIETIATRLIFEGRFPAVIAAISRRIHEKGYLAHVLPVPLAPLLARVDASPLFFSIGGYPIENQPGSRPLRSVATELFRACGDLPLHVAFRSSAVDTIGPGPASLSEVIGPAFRSAAARPFRIADVREPYRSRLLRAMRAVFDADTDRISAAVEGGAVFVVAPEGGYSSDGRMRRLGGIRRKMTALAKVWLTAISYDPFRGRRLSMLLNIVPAASDDTAGQLAAARPVTTSAALAAWLCARLHEPFSAAEAGDGVAAIVAALPDGTLVDPETQDAGAVSEALDGLVHAHALVAIDGRYRPVAPLRDPRFPHIPDMIAYQARFLLETIDAAERRSKARSAGGGA
jgi:hypothetical protein